MAAAFGKAWSCMAAQMQVATQPDALVRPRLADGFRPRGPFEEVEVVTGVGHLASRFDLAQGRRLSARAGLRQKPTL